MNLQTTKHSLPEFEIIKSDHEKLLWLGKPQLASFRMNMIFKGVIGLLLIILVVVINHYTTIEQQGSLTLVYLLLALVFVPNAIKYLLRAFSYRNIAYGFSDQRVLMRGGLISTDLKMIDYDKVVDVEVKVNFIDRHFGTGTIRIDAGQVNKDDDGNTTKIFDNWLHVENPYEVAKMLNKVIVDIKTDYNYPNANRPAINPGYSTKYKPS